MASFIQKARRVHGDKYDYSKVDYKNSTTKVTIICPEHGEFKQRPSDHLKGHGCKQCGLVKLAKINQQRALTIGSFIQKARKIHGDKYDYSKVDYKNAHTKVTIICPEHGEFKQRPSGHLVNGGCIKCGLVASIRNRSRSTKEFIQKARRVHGDKYDYSKVDYKNSTTKVTIICPEHGEFKQRPSDHLKGHGCSRCGMIDNVKNRTKSADSFIQKARRVHGDKYDYSKVCYKDRRTKVVIICPEHGEFKQTPDSHMSDRGCPKCGRVSSMISCLGTTDNFIEKAKLVHNNKYDYSRVDYKNAHTKVTIICPEHGEFKQRPYGHLYGYGCVDCAREDPASSGELELIKFVKSLDVEVWNNIRSLIYPYELDIVVPNHKLAIEFDGLYWHSYNNPLFEKKKYHLIKTEKCTNVGYKLIHIFENEWLDKSEIVKSKLSYMLGIALYRIYARKCKIVELDNKYCSQFFELSHIQGHRTAKIAYGLMHDGRMVAAISFSRYRGKQWEIIRYAVKPYYSVVGGFSKLLKHFIRNIKPLSIITYADRRYSDGGVYKNNGFILDKIVPPNYYYVLGNKLFSRQAFQKRKLADKLGKFDPQKTEAENMFANGYRRIWDCGHFRYYMSLDSSLL